jgi:hypothetical protein
MNNINENVNLKDMYYYQQNLLDKSDYQNYDKYLTEYFKKESKKDKFIRSFENGKYVLTDIKKSKEKILIKPPKFTNINELYDKLKTYSDEILYKISNLIESKNNITEENRQEFESLKNRYILFSKEIKEIDIIYDEHFKKMKEMIDKKIENITKLFEYHQKRKLAFSKIEGKIEEKAKNDLIKRFNENNKKIPSLQIINKLAKNHEISSKNIENWYGWIEASYQYLIIKNELNKLNKEIENMEKNFEEITNYMMIQKPIIEKIN